MFGRRRAAQPKGQGAAAAKQVTKTVPARLHYCCTLSFGSDVSHSTSWFQMGLFLELDPEQVMTEGNLDDPDLEAELAALTGNAAGAGGRVKPKGKS